MSTLNRAAYEQLISEDLEWRDTGIPRPVFRHYSTFILRQSADREYGAARSTRACRAVSMLRLVSGSECRRETDSLMDFINKSGLEFTDISSEEWREYQFETRTVRINEPLWLHVSRSGGHRVFDAEGFSYYIMPTWLVLRWRAKEGQPHFVK